MLLTKWLKNSWHWHPVILSHLKPMMALLQDHRQQVMPQRLTHSNTRSISQERKTSKKSKNTSIHCQRPSNMRLYLLKMHISLASKKTQIGQNVTVAIFTNMPVGFSKLAPHACSSLRSPTIPFSTSWVIISKLNMMKSRNNRKVKAIQFQNSLQLHMLGSSVNLRLTNQTNLRRS